MAVAEKYMKLAGFPSGKYTGNATVQVVGSTGNPASTDAEIANQTLKNLGFKTKFTLVHQSAMYSKYCGVVSEEIDVCPNVGWLADFADGQAVLQVPFSGESIVTNGTNSNWGQVNNPKINKAMKAAENVVGKSARAAAWAAEGAPRVSVGAARWHEVSRARSRVRERCELVVVEQVGRDAGTTGSAIVRTAWNEASWDYSFSSLK